MVKYEFQVNMKYSERVSACGVLGVVVAPSLPELLRRIMKKFGIRLDQIEKLFLMKASICSRKRSPIMRSK